MIIRYSPALLALAITSLLPVEALWPFTSRPPRPRSETLINAGSLGLDDPGLGRVIAVADWNGDQHTDLFTLSSDEKTLVVHLYDAARRVFTPGPTYTASARIVNVVPADWNHDGRLDVLLVLEGKPHGWWGGDDGPLGMRVLLGAKEGFGEEWDVPGSTGQTLVYDADGSLRPSLLGLHQAEGEEKASLRSWTNTGRALELHQPPLVHPEDACVLASPHSSAFIDIDGDCVPDLVLHCASGTAAQSVQVWLNRGERGYELARTYELPKGAGPLSFADMNRDGTIDILFPVCAHHAPSSGIATNCELHVVYNRQVPICSAEGASINPDGSLGCRGWGALCVADPNFGFDFSKPDRLASAMDILLSVPGKDHIPLPLRVGDYNVDGYPDVALTAVRDSGALKGKQHIAQVLANTPCASEGCTGERALIPGQGAGWEALERITDAQGVSWVDVDDDGSLDLLVQRSGEQGEGRTTFVLNNFAHDAFFLRAKVLNGACEGECSVGNSKETYSGLGSVHAGASVKFTVLDTLGKRGAQQVPQLPQTAHHALGLPFAFIGLGRTNNYVERMTIGTALHRANLTDLDSIIPNSQLLITPPSPLALPGEDDESSPVRPTEWRIELFLKPGEWVPWVAASVLGTVLALGGVVWVLHQREKREDEQERRRALHAINFQAL